MKLRPVRSLLGLSERQYEPTITLDPCLALRKDRLGSIASFCGLMSLSFILDCSVGVHSLPATPLNDVVLLKSSSPKNRLLKCPKLGVIGRESLGVIVRNSECCEDGRDGECWEDFVGDVTINLPLPLVPLPQETDAKGVEGADDQPRSVQPWSPRSGDDGVIGREHEEGSQL